MFFFSYVFCEMHRLPPISNVPDTLCPYTTLFLSRRRLRGDRPAGACLSLRHLLRRLAVRGRLRGAERRLRQGRGPGTRLPDAQALRPGVAMLSRIHAGRSEEHTSELQSLMRISYAVFCLIKNKHRNI